MHYFSRDAPIGTVSGAFAQDFHKGLEAAQKCDHATALREWRPLEEQGGTEAQVHLGANFLRRHGGIQEELMA
mgnify:CR=1 FL=1